MRREDMPLGEIEEVKETSSRAEVNKLLKEGWIFLDAKVGQYSKGDESKSYGHYILGRRVGRR